MRYFFLAFLLFSISNSFAQKLKRYEISKDLSIDFPENFQVIDTLKQRIVKGSIGNEDVMIMAQKDSLATIENQEDLLEYYEGVKNGIVEKAGGKLLEKENVKMKGLDLLKLRCKLKIRGEEKIWESLSLFLNNYTYSIVFLHSAETDNNFNDQKKKILASLELRKGLSAQNQLNSNEESSRAFKWGKLTGTILFYVFIGTILFFVVRSLKKKKVTHDV